MAPFYFKHIMNLIFTNRVSEALDSTVDGMKPASVFVLVDDNTAGAVLPILHNRCQCLKDATVIRTPADDINKTVEALTNIWRILSDNGATRRSVLINLGGGMVTDLGGFAAATFKRGIRFINVPTTLLGAVDAATGGKTGINFAGLKNEVGVFCDADAVIISTIFLNTLPPRQLLSGYAEMLKHGFIDGADTLTDLLRFDITSQTTDHDTLLSLIERSVGVKSHIVDADPTERGLRRVLNLGHTAGHAFESLAMERNSPVPHGYAVAWGLMVELILSHIALGFPAYDLHRFAAYVSGHYGKFTYTCKDYPRLLELMSHDKKNPNPDTISFTLLRAVGQPEPGHTVAPDQIRTALDLYQDF